MFLFDILMLFFRPEGGRLQKRVACTGTAYVEGRLSSDSSHGLCQRPLVTL